MRRRTTRREPAAEHDELAGREPEQLVAQVRSLLAEAQALSTRLAALNEVAVAMQASLDTEAVLSTLASQARWVLDFQHCSIALRHGDRYHVRVLRGVQEKTSDQQSIENGAIGQTLREGRALLIKELVLADGAPVGMQSALILPLRNEGGIIGTLNFYARSAGRYSIDDLRVAYGLAVQVAAMLQNVRLFDAATRARDELHTVLESISDSVLVVDQRGRILLMNSSLRQMLGIGGEILVGRRALSLLRAAPSQGWQFVTSDSLREALATLKAEPPSAVSGTTQLADGRHVEWASAPLVGTGTVMGSVLTVRDISARAELEQLRTDMIHMLVHDLRTPLTGLIMGLDMLQIDQESDVDQREMILNYTKSSANHLLDRINTILDMSKLEAGRLELDLIPCKIEMLLELTMAPLWPLAEEAHKQIRLELAADLPSLVLDMRLIQRVLENIIGNALKWTPRNGTVEISARIDNTGEQLEVLVQDSGPGVPAEQREHIFEKYGQVRRTDQRQGTGLGLTFCKLVVEAHSGRIGVRAAPHVGSIFWFSLPLS